MINRDCDLIAIAIKGDKYHVLVEPGWSDKKLRSVLIDILKDLNDLEVRK